MVYDFLPLFEKFHGHQTEEQDAKHKQQKDIQDAWYCLSDVSESSANLVKGWNNDCKVFHWGLNIQTTVKA